MFDRFFSLKISHVFKDYFEPNNGLYVNATCPYAAWKETF
jgi:hypothetical protein